MLKKIERIIGGVEELSISAMTSWFPTISKDEIICEIKKSDRLIIENNMIIDKKLKERKDEDYLVNKNLNLINKVRDMKPKEIIKDVQGSKEMVTIKEENIVHDVSNLNKIKYEDLIELIDSYNKGVKENYKRLINKSFENVSEAILKYYKKRFNIIKDDFTLEDGGIIYSLRHKKSGLEVAYVYIGEYLSKKSLDEIEYRFEYDTVYFCITKDAEVSPNLSTREFYLKDVEEITEAYLGRYKLLESKVGILKIDD